MNLYIKGMSLPKEKIVCLLVSPDGQAFVKSESGQEEKYQLMPIPEHGRLIYEKDIVPKDGYIISDGMACIPVKDIVNAPTIIPADKEGEGYQVKGDCDICANGKLPSYSATCVDCGLSRKNYKPITNYDTIVSKTPYELADWIAKILDHCENKMPDELCRQSCPLYKCCNDQPSDNIEDWLKSPVEEPT